MKLKLMPVAALLAASLASPISLSQNKYDTCANDKEIRIGTTNPYS